jgi:hypothetical protein
VYAGHQLPTVSPRQHHIEISTGEIPASDTASHAWRQHGRRLDVDIDIDDVDNDDDNDNDNDNDE